MKTLQERLRIKAGMITLGEKISWGSETALMYEAANKLDELEKQNDELRAKLQAPATVAIDERAEFEKWYNSHIMTAVDIKTYAMGPHLKAQRQRDRLNIAYEAWQAARKLSAPEVVSKTTDTVVPDILALDEISNKLLSVARDVDAVKSAMLKGGGRNDFRRTT